MKSNGRRSKIGRAGKKLDSLFVFHIFLVTQSVMFQFTGRLGNVFGEKHIYGREG